jgi:hypothetical protein
MPAPCIDRHAAGTGDGCVGIDEAGQQAAPVEGDGGWPAWPTRTVASLPTARMRSPIATASAIVFCASTVCTPRR